jgi:PAS domain S-box-containing protein
MLPEKAKILIVEDESIVARDIETSLLGFGYEVVGKAASAKEAIVQTDAHRPHLVLMDIVLSGDVDGVDAAAFIRSNYRIPVVFLTAFADEGTVERAKTAGPFGYIIKPFEERELRTTIELAIYKHRQEKALEESRDLFITMIKSMGDAMIAVDRDLRVTFMNPVAAYLTGHDEAVSIGKPIDEIAFIKCLNSGEAIGDLARKTLREGITVYLGADTLLTNKRGFDVPVGDSIAPIKDAKGNIIGAILVFQDFSAVRRSEEQARRDSLELRRGNEELRKLTAFASHDMREPLRKVMSLGSLLRKKYGDVLNDEGRDYLDRMQSATLRMEGYLGSVLNLARIGAAKTPMQPVDLNRAVADAVSDLEPRLRETGGTVEYGGLPTLNADPVQMCQLFLNLIGNALKYRRPDAAPVVKIDARRLEGQKAFWEIAVADNGIGMDDGRLNRIFEPFERLRERKDVEGWGIGLAICRKIVERHGGELSVVSKPGKGSTFSIRLPA